MGIYDLQKQFLVRCVLLIKFWRLHIVPSWVVEGGFVGLYGIVCAMCMQGVEGFLFCGCCFVCKFACNFIASYASLCSYFLYRLSFIWSLVFLGLLL